MQLIIWRTWRCICDPMYPRITRLSFVIRAVHAGYVVYIDNARYTYASPRALGA